jgi:hypothetical protein
MFSCVHAQISYKVAPHKLEADYIIKDKQLWPIKQIPKD